jgi:hypothetical protein
MEPQAFNEDDAGDPAVAFEALRETVESLAVDLTREMTTIRKGAEAAFDRMEIQGVPVDYSAELGRMTQQIAMVVERLQAVEKSPFLQQGAEHYAHVLERSGQTLVHSAVQQLQRQANDFERAGRQLTEFTKSAYVRKDQDFRMWMMGGVGAIVGMILLVLLPRVLPMSADSYVASLIMGRDRLSAGRAMIEAADPKAAQDIMTAGWVYETNREVVDKCIQDMFKGKKEQRCTLTLPVVDGRSRP